MSTYTCPQFSEMLPTVPQKTMVFSTGANRALCPVSYRPLNGTGAKGQAQMLTYFPVFWSLGLHALTHTPTHPLTHVALDCLYGDALCEHRFTSHTKWCPRWWRPPTSPHTHTHTHMALSQSWLSEVTGPALVAVTGCLHTFPRTVTKTPHLCHFDSTGRGASNTCQTPQV